MSTTLATISENSLDINFKKNDLKVDETYYFSIVATSPELEHQIVFEPAAVFLPKLRKNSALFYMGNF